MAAMTTPNPSSSSSSSSSTAVTNAQPNTSASGQLLQPSRNPLPLTASQEGQVRELYYKNVRNRCKDEVRDFAACATGRTFTATIMCRAQRSAMNNCMNSYATREMQDAAREEWFQTMDRRREERAEKERKRKEDEVFWKDWWDKEKKTKELGEFSGGEKGKK